MPITPKHRLRRFHAGRPAYERVAAKENLSMAKAVGLMSPSAARDVVDDVNEENAFINRAQTSFKRDMMYRKKGEGLGYSRPGDTKHKAQLKARMARMSGFKKKMFGKAYNTYDPNNRYKRMNPVVKAYSNIHRSDYDTYTKNQMYNGQQS